MSKTKVINNHLIMKQSESGALDLLFNFTRQNQSFDGEVTISIGGKGINENIDIYIANMVIGEDFRGGGLCKMILTYCLKMAYKMIRRLLIPYISKQQLTGGVLIQSVNYDAAFNCYVHAFEEIGFNLSAYSNPEIEGKKKLQHLYFTEMEKKPHIIAAQLNEELLVPTFGDHFTITDSGIKNGGGKKKKKRKTRRKKKKGGKEPPRKKRRLTLETKRDNSVPDQSVEDYIEEQEQKKLQEQEQKKLQEEEEEENPEGVPAQREFHSNDPRPGADPNIFYFWSFVKPPGGFHWTLIRYEDPFYVPNTTMEDEDVTLGIDGGDVIQLDDEDYENFMDLIDEEDMTHEQVINHIFYEIYNLDVITEGLGAAKILSEMKKQGGKRKKKRKTKRKKKRKRKTRKKKK